MQKQGDYTLVFLHEDKNIFDTKGKIPIQSWKQRRNNLKILGVNKVVKVKDYDDLARKFTKFIKRNKDILFMRGDDWVEFPCRKVLEEYNVKIKIIPYTKGISSTVLRNHLAKEG